MIQDDSLYLTRHGQILTNAIVRRVLSFQTDRRKKRFKTVGDLVNYLHANNVDLDQFRADVGAKGGSYSLSDEISLDSLTPKGQQQAAGLGIFLNDYLSDRKNDVLFVTSELERSIRTAEIAAGQMGISLNAQNHYASSAFDEVVPLEYMLEEGAVNFIGNVELPDPVKIAMERKDIRVLNIYARQLEQGSKLRWFFEKKSEKEYGRKFEADLLDVREKYGARPIVAVLHGNINKSLLSWKGCIGTADKLLWPNCELVEFGYNSEGIYLPKQMVDKKLASVALYSRNKA